MSNPNILIDGVGHFIETAENAGIVTQGVFEGSAINSGMVTTTASFSGTAVNSGVVQSAVFAGNASNTGSVTVAVFTGTTINTGTVEQAEFRDSASNSGTVSVSAVFADSASNDGTVQGDAVFADTTVNNGTVQGDAQVASTATNSGTVQGTVSEYVPPAASNWYDDTSSPPHTITLNGTVTQDDEGSGVKAALFGADGYLNVTPQAGDFEFAGDFTLEAFVKQPSNNTVDYSIFVESDGANYFALNVNNTYVSTYLNSSTPVFGANMLNADAWNHLALVRSGTVVTLYANGVGTVIDSNNSGTLGFTSLAFSWIRHNSSPAGEGKLAGFRMTDTAVYTGNFTVPTSLPTAVTGTHVLLNFGATAVPTV